MLFLVDVNQQWQRFIENQEAQKQWDLQMACFRERGSTYVQPKTSNLQPRCFGIVEEHPASEAMGAQCAASSTFLSKCPEDWWSQ